MKSYLSILPATAHRPFAVLFCERCEGITPFRPDGVSDGNRLYRHPQTALRGAIEEMNGAGRSGIDIAPLVPIVSFLFREKPGPHAISRSAALIANAAFIDDRSDSVTH